MILPKPSDAFHQSRMYRLLIAIADDAFLAKQLRFKGGTCAAMRSLLPRFSVDLDFDMVDESGAKEVRSHLEKVFKTTDFTIDDQSRRYIQYFLKYQSEPRMRSTLKVDVSTISSPKNIYEPVRLEDIDRVFYCHTVPTMVANKLVALLGRKRLVGRDVFDIHQFFWDGRKYDPDIVTERTGKSLCQVLEKSIQLLEKTLTQTTIDQDLNTLLAPELFKRLRKTLKQETLMLLKDELKRVQGLGKL